MTLQYAVSDRRRHRKKNNNKKQQLNTPLNERLKIKMAANIHISTRLKEQFLNLDQIPFLRSNMNGQPLVI